MPHRPRPAFRRDSGLTSVCIGGVSIRFQILGSSSAGNCALLRTAESCVLIDAGFTGRRLEAMLEAAGVSIEQVQAVFITHEHSDHTVGLPGLSGYGHLEFFATHATALHLQETKLKRPVRWRIFEHGSRFAFRDLEVATLPIPHDAYDPVAYAFHAGSGDLFHPRRGVAWVTDLGHVPPGLAEFTREVQLLVLESNHDPEMLEADTKRPFQTKQRIRGRHGHLSNQDALGFLRSLPKHAWRRLALAHLSKDCNCPQLVGRLHAQAGIGLPLDVIAPEGAPGPLLDLAHDL